MNTELAVQIRTLRLEAEGVISLELVAVQGGELPPWQPGAHIDLLLPSGLIRQYSLCSEPANRRLYRIGVLLEKNGRGGSQEVHHSLRPGQQLAIRGPRNTFALEPAVSYLFVAGGIGITPILSMVRAAEQSGADWTLLYGGRTRRSMAFIDELQAINGGRVEILPADEVGLLDLQAIRPLAAESGQQVYSCGPPALLDALSETFAQAALASSLHLERFSPKTAKPAKNAADGSFRVILARSGTEVEVPAGCSIMAALRAAGQQIPSSCEQGICGTCETRVLDGIPDHRDHLLSARERESSQSLMLCVSRALTETLTLDL